LIADKECLRNHDCERKYESVADTEPEVVFPGVYDDGFQTEHLQDSLVVALPLVQDDRQSHDESEDDASIGDCLHYTQDLLQLLG